MPIKEDDVDIYFEDELDDMSNVSSESSKKNDRFTKVQRRNKKKNKVVIGHDEYGNERCIFSSKVPGTYIYSATTGHRTNYKVGSSDEDLFFSVIDSIASDKNKEPIFFYFDSPEQIERVMEIRISQKTKELWHKKFLLAKNRIINKS
jgi:hypothetical protein